MTNKTLCVRHYVNYGKDHSGPGNIKIARAGSPDGISFQASYKGGVEGGTTDAFPKVTWISRPAGVECNMENTGDASTRLRFEDCQENWCRFEICAEHDGSTGKTNVRAQWAQVGGPRFMESRSGLTPPSNQPWKKPCAPTRTSRDAYLIGGTVDIAETTTVGCCPSAPGGSRYVSHVMLSIVDYDPNFWIGKAYEIEGGGDAPQASLGELEAHPRPRFLEGTFSLPIRMISRFSRKAGGLLR